MENKTVLVTGANGHLGYNLVKKLVDKGYSVRAGVRDINDNNKIGLLKKLNNVTLVNADITKLDQLIEASKGVDAFFHVAAVFAMHSKDPEITVIKPTVDGALNAMKAVNINKIPKIVLTSSMVAIGHSFPEDKPCNESNWNDHAKIPYDIGKLKAERLAWEFAEKHEINLVVVNPTMIMGPVASGITVSLKVIKDLMEMNVPMLPPLAFNTIDVRDVVDAHIRVYEDNNSNGRYICATEPVSYRKMAELVSKYYGSKVPKLSLNRFNFIMYARLSSFFARLFGKEPLITTQQAKTYSAGKLYVDSSKLRALGWIPISIEKSIEDTVKSISLM